MANSYFQFKQFTIHQDQCSMKVTTDSCLFGAWVASNIGLTENKKQLLDIGSGSGLLSLMLAQETTSIIEGIEIQNNDYRQSLKNICDSPFKDRIKIHHHDAATFIYPHRYNIIVSNPPFYQNQLKSISGEKNKAHHDDALTLEMLFNIFKKQLASNGSFYILLPENRLDECMKQADSGQFFINKIAWIHQTENHKAFRIMLQGSTQAGIYQTEKILIKERNIYSADFVALLKKYYLHL